jgi:hypothetical protein
MLLIHSREPYTTFSEEMGAGLFKRRILTKYQSTSHYMALLDLGCKDAFELMQGGTDREECKKVIVGILYII